MTTRAWLVSLIASLVLVACGDDGNNAATDQCGDGTIAGTEECDDGNTANGDGCSATCELERGAQCGNGMIDASEECDDRNTADGDGCTNCTIDEGYMCQGAPSVCVEGEFPEVFDGSCENPFVIELTDDGSGALSGSATGDTTAATNHFPAGDCDGDDDAGGGNDLIYTFTLTQTSDVDIAGPDGSSFDIVLRLSTAACMAATQVPDNFGTNGCADSSFSSAELLSYTALPPGTYYVAVDGYDDVESGSFQLSIDTYPTACGNGMLDNIFEECDDGALDPGDGCSAACEIEEGYVCDDAEPSVCEMQCGNGVIDADEECDDDDAEANDGCSATCQIEPGYACTDAEPSVCAMTCGNGAIDAGETCDDGDMMNDDGCSDNCVIESGWACTGTPSTCVETLCNDGEFDDEQEECDDQNSTPGDGCSQTCTLESDVMEVEPNDTTPQVIGYTLTDGDAHIRVRGGFTDDDVDLYQFTLTAPAIVSIETYDSINGLDDYLGVGELGVADCLNLDTVVAVYGDGDDYTNDDDAIFIDDDDGDIYCSYIGPNDADGDDTEGFLQPGTYVIRVTNDIAYEPYILDITIDGTTTPVDGGLSINEVFIDPGPAADTNCDGTFSNTADEFIELVNTSTATIDLTGMSVYDKQEVLRHTFSADDTTGRMDLLPGEAVVIWAGGAPNCPGVDNWFEASSGSLGLSNSGGEQITVRLGTTVIASATFNSHTQGVSLNKDPDVTGTTYANHDEVAGAAGRLFSPGTRVDGTAFLP